MRAVSPAGLIAAPLIVPGASQVALTAYYGSPLRYLGYTPLKQTATNSWTRVTHTFAVGDHPLGVAFHPDGEVAYVANGNDRTVGVVDVATHSVIKTIPVAQQPWEVAFAPNGAVAYVTHLVVRGDGHPLR